MAILIQNYGTSGRKQPTRPKTTMRGNVDIIYYIEEDPFISPRYNARVNRLILAKHPNPQILLCTLVGVLMRYILFSLKM